MQHSLKQSILILSLIIASIVFLAGFLTADQNNYNEYTKIYKHGSLRIEIIHHKSKNNEDIKNHDFYYCEALLNIYGTKGNKILEKKFSDKGPNQSLDPVGGHYGLFVPNQPYLGEYFIVIKLGAYDGRMFLINKKGELIDMPGGFYFVTKNKPFIFSVSDSDEPVLSVFDYEKNKEIYSSDKIPYAIPYIYQWYESKESYLFTETEKTKPVYVYDFKQNKVIKEGKDLSEFKLLKKIYSDFDPDKFKDCGGS